MKKIRLFLITLVILLSILSVQVSATDNIQESDTFLSNQLQVTSVIGLNVREGPGLEYEIIGGVAKNTIVDTIEATDEWVKIRFEDLEGWIAREYTSTSIEIPITMVISDKNDPNLYLFPEAEVIKSGAWLEEELAAEAARIAAEEEAARKAAEEKARRLAAETAKTPEPQPSYTPSAPDPTPTPAPAPTPSYSSTGSEIVDCAMQYLGVPYVWGGTSPSGFDCSGFVQYVYKQCGYSISRTASSQYYDGYSVSYSNLQPGDLIFFERTYATDGISHIGIYIGGGEFIHAGGGCVKITSLDSSYYSSRYYGACRII